MWNGRPERVRRMRLSPEEYETPGAICSVTLAVKGREKLFASAELAGLAVSVLKDTERSQRAPVHAYCVMPDHVHLVIEASSTCSVSAFVSRFKNDNQRRSRALGALHTFWQRGFWDNVIRGPAHLEREVLYVLANPVRAGIVSEWHEYPHSASVHIERPRPR